ncbi:hypothetical protein A5651_06630 [Mycobacterium sp. 1274761.0]|nr:hypothetical protein A5651_06630 [Mycobacterium sp. 1274761.0]
MAALAVAGPAYADNFEDGKYIVVRTAGLAPGHHPGAADAMWTVSSCGPGCKQVDGDIDISWQMHLVDGRWTGSTHRAEAVDCKNGTWASGTMVLSLDPQTLRGKIVSSSDGPACGSPTPITAGTVDLQMGHA